MIPTQREQAEKAFADWMREFHSPWTVDAWLIAWARSRAATLREVIDRLRSVDYVNHGVLTTLDAMLHESEPTNLNEKGRP